MSYPSQGRFLGLVPTFCRKLLLSSLRILFSILFQEQSCLICPGLVKINDYFKENHLPGIAWTLAVYCACRLIDFEKCTPNTLYGDLRWLKIASSTYILMRCYNHSCYNHGIKNCLRGQCHEDFAVLDQFWAKIITLRLYS